MNALPFAVRSVFLMSLLLMLTPFLGGPACLAQNDEPVPGEEEAQPEDFAIRLVKAAREQVGTTVSYDPAYVVLKYPGGDVPMETGVCSDVVVRAYRALGIDLQVLIHEDMKANFQAYPSHWGLKRTDRNIDHRRVLNMQRFFERKRAEIKPLTTDPKKFLPGDLVTCIVPPNLPHIMIVSDKTSAQDPNRHLIIHNIGRGAREEDRLLEFKLTGHYRWHPEAKQGGGEGSR